MAVVIISALFLSSQHLTEVDQMFLNSGSQNSLNLQQVNKISMKFLTNNINNNEKKTLKKKSMLLESSSELKDYFVAVCEMRK